MLADHDRIEHHVRGAMAIEPGGDRLDDRRVGQHADLHRADIEIGKHRVHLCGDEIRRHIVNAEHALGVLRGERGDDAGAIDAERREGFQIGLDAGAAARIRAGDGERDRNAPSRASAWPASRRRLRASRAPPRPDRAQATAPR